MNLVGALTGANDRSYGMEVRDKTTFIVSSGISDWSIKFKTGCFSEYVIIDVTQK
jgi:predicted MPP superfamily phosphohydrolase